MLVRLNLDDLSSPSRSFSGSITVFAGRSSLSDQSRQVFGSEIVPELAFRECFAEIAVTVSHVRLARAIDLPDDAHARSQ
jgi:hypothetical protein